MKKQQHKQKDLTYEQLVSSLQYIQLREQVLKEINTFCPKISFEVFKKTDEEKGNLLTAKKNWTANNKDFAIEFTKYVPNFGAFKFNNITIA